MFDIELEKKSKHTEKQDDPDVFQPYWYKAILNPIHYDNYDLWRLLSKYDIKSSTIYALTNRLHANKWHTVFCADGMYISYPDTKSFFLEAFSFDQELSMQLQIIFKKCAHKKHLHAHDALVSDILALDYKPKPNDTSKKSPHVFESTIWGHPKNTNSHHPWDMFLLSGFFAAIGCGAVAIALTLLSSAAAITALTVGGMSSLAAVGLFAYSTYKYVQKNSFTEQTPTP